MKRDPRLVRLSEEHHHGLVFALRIEREVPTGATPTLAALYADLLRFWVRGLLPHFHAESECLLARLIRHVPPSDPDIQRLQADHLTMEGLVARMRDVDSLHDRRQALLDFGRTLRDHIRWEEQTLFERTQRELNDDELTAAGDEIRSRLPKPTGPPWAES